LRAVLPDDEGLRRSVPSGSKYSEQGLLLRHAGAVLRHALLCQGILEPNARVATAAN
jgi:hypothetical protein